MQIEFDKRYPVAATPEQAWAVLADVRATAACWPGASLGRSLDARRHQGTLGLQVGAEAVRLDGGIELLGLDAARHELRLRGEGGDGAGSTASLQLVVRIEAGDVPGSSALAGHAGVTVRGSLARLDKHLLATVGDRLLAQFADNFRAAAAAVPAPGGLSARGGGARGTGAGAGAGAGAGRRSAERSAVGAESTLTLMVQGGQAPGAAFAANDVEPAQVDAPPGAWAALRQWLSRLFSRGPAP